jgi:ketosteroid isomerase-like protein
MSEGQIRQQIQGLVESVRAMDLERAMSFFAPDVVSFDMEPPLSHVRAESKRRNWAKVFEMFAPPLKYETHDLAITGGDDGVAFAHSLNQISGTMRNGRHIAMWVRWTACFRRIDENWLIVHDHVSVPADLESGSAQVQLEP